YFVLTKYGIRYRNVTGVQTCALPICLRVVSLLCSGGFSGGSAAGPAATCCSDVVIIASPTATVRVGHHAGLSHRRGPGPRGFLGSGPRLLGYSGPMSR